MKLIKVQSWAEVKNVIRECFDGDNELIETYHIKAGEGLDACVEDTFNVLKFFTHPDFEFYKIDDEGLCGFIGIEPSENYLTTFCLKKEFRYEDYKKELWELITGFFNEFNCGLYGKNKRAINYLLKNGCEVVAFSTYNEHDIVILNYKKEVTCHSEAQL